MSVIKPGQTIGILGGGQLGQMMASVAKSMGYRIHSYDQKQNCPLALLSDAHTVGRFDDINAMLQFSQGCDVLTYEFENIDADCVAVLNDHCLIPQGVSALQISSDRYQEYRYVHALGVRTLDCIAVHSLDAVHEAVKTIGFPCILKSVRLGYDGHGQIWIHSKADLEELVINQPYLMMRVVDVDKEISVVCARGQHGTVMYPCIENHHTSGILDYSIVPAGISAALSDEAYRTAARIVDALDYSGVMAFEFFVENGILIFNEMAPRPHNSGHFSIEGMTSSQFRAHIEAICGLHIHEPQLIDTSMMVNILGQHQEAARDYLITKNTEGFYHDYGKDMAIHNRKMGHMTFVSEHAVRLGTEFRSVIRQ